MKTSKVVYNGNLRCELTHLKSGIKIITDAPTDNHGKGEAFSPTDLLSTSLAACMFTLMGIYADKHNVIIESGEAEVLKTMSSEPPRRVVKIEIDFNLKVKDLTENIKQALINTARNCPVSKSLSPEIQQITSFNFV